MTAHARQTLEAEVLNFVKREVPRPRPRAIGPDTELERDLRMIWEDIEGLLVKFFRDFHVDQASFDFMRYVAAPRPLKDWFKPRPRVKPLTIRMLVDAAEQGRWVDNPDTP